MSTTISRPRTTRSWRSVDLVTAAVLGVAFGVVFWGWDVVYAAVSPVFAVLPPLAGLLGGVWLLPAVVGALVVRRPGAALLAEMVAATVEALLGSSFGFTTLASGAVQGLGVEIVVAVLVWKRWGPAVAAAAGALAGILEAVFEQFTWYAGTWTLPFQAVYVVTFAVSGAVVAGLGGWALVRAMARAGALGAFPAGRERR